MRIRPKTPVPSQPPREVVERVARQAATWNRTTSTAPSTRPPQSRDASNRTLPSPKAPRQNVGRDETSAAVRAAVADVRSTDLAVAEAMSQSIFSERTHRHRRLLVLTSAISLAMSLFGFVPREIEFLGLSFEEAERESLLRGGAVVVMYFLLMFIVPGYLEVQTWRSRLRGARARHQSARDAANEVQEARDVDQQAARDAKRHQERFLAGAIAYSVEVLLPIGLAAIALYFALTEVPRAA